MKNNKEKAKMAEQYLSLDALGEHKGMQSGAEATEKSSSDDSLK